MKSTTRIFKEIHQMLMESPEIYKGIHVIWKGIHVILSKAIRGPMTSFKEIYEGIYESKEGTM